METRLNEAFAEGARLFDAGQYWDAHEAWEVWWRVETDETKRRLLQGLIQIAAGFHKLVVTKSPESASRLLTKGLAKLEGAEELSAFHAAVTASARLIAEGSFDANAIPVLVR